MTRALLATIASSLLVACGSAPAPAPPAATTEAPVAPTVEVEAAPPLEGETVDGCFVMEGAPDPVACDSADDCVSGGLFQPAACCMGGESHPHARAYHTWQTTLFRARCDGTCITPPSRPLDCELVLRCDDGACTNDCGRIAAPSDHTLDAMDRSELETACEAGSTGACDRLGH